VIDSGAGQVPQHSISTGEGTLLLARNPTGIAIIPAPLTQDLRAVLDSPHPAVRLGAVNALGTWLTGSDPAKALGAEEALRLIADNEIFSISSAARAYLGDVQAPRRMAAAETRVPRAARRTGSLAQWGLVAGFLALLIALGVYSVAILQSSARAYPLEAVVIVCAAGIPCALVGARKNVITASIILWNLSLLVVPPSLAAIGYLSHIPSPLWDAIASLGFVALLAGIPVLTRMVR
jgi:hypothetical protein